MREAGHEVDVRLGLEPAALIDAVVGADAVIIRSATKVTAEGTTRATEMVVVGRAGIGLDNVDVEHATTRGVMVVNAPQSNILSAAEHTVALLLAEARNIPQAHAAVVEGRWERSRWEGVELADKVLGIIGLGRIGRLVAERAHVFGMRLVVFDPFVSSERARQMNVDLVDLDELVADSDFITIHVAKTKETMGLVGAELLAKTKPGVRIINVAAASSTRPRWRKRYRRGHVGGAAIDVFAEEPTTDSPLFALPQVVVTPHLGAAHARGTGQGRRTPSPNRSGLHLQASSCRSPSTCRRPRRQRRSGPSCHWPNGSDASTSCSTTACPAYWEIDYQGQLADYDPTRILTLSVLKGVFAEVSDEPVSYVNACRRWRPSVASTCRTVTDIDCDRLHQPRHRARRRTRNRGDAERAEGRLLRIVMLDDHSVEVPPARATCSSSATTTGPGMIAKVTSALGRRRHQHLRHGRGPNHLTARR